jgi:hypothetical protein
MPIPTNKDNMPGTRRCCSRCGHLGHLVTTCKQPHERAYNMVGIEVEGYWRDATFREVRRIAEDNWHMSGTTDGSLNEHSGFQSYEWRTRPGSLGEAINQLVAVYPDATDSQVGMHVHVSVSPSDVMALCSLEFFTYFREQWEVWGEKNQLNRGTQFWKRLHGYNSYCRPNTLAVFRGLNGTAAPRFPPMPETCGDTCECDDCADATARHEAGVELYNIQLAEWNRLNDCKATRRVLVSHQTVRYQQLNFLAYENHGTVECRLLPMFRDARLAVAAVEHFVWIVESFLANAEEAVYSRGNRKVKVPTIGDACRVSLASEVALAKEETREPIVRSAGLYEMGTPADGHRVMPRTQVNSYLTSQGVL